ncbi:hypothetical protein [Flavivirga rizhaonensis]|uniref:hypothetical protein n=1 Tax=Flavivirga rizhaonensis TaxID=2559571 RepID=UPI001476A3B2|nr:hypothetical protein [Flavivirga rizhaonensis]
MSLGNPSGSRYGKLAPSGGYNLYVIVSHSEQDEIINQFTEKITEKLDKIGSIKTNLE